MATLAAAEEPQVRRVGLRVLAGVLGVASFAILVISVLVWGSQGFPHLPASFAHGLPSVLLGLVAAVSYVGIGWFLAARVPGNPIGWLLLVAGLVLTTIMPVSLVVAEAHEAFRPAPASTLFAAWLLSSFGTPFLVGGVVVAGMLFPDGRLLTRRWRWGALLGVLAAGLLALSAAVDPEGLVWYPTLPNPYAAPSEAAPILLVWRIGGVAMLIAAIGLLIASLGLRYRRGDATVRAQLRWILYAASVQCLSFVPFVLARYVVDVGEGVGELTVAVAEAGSATLPIAAAVAITRYRLFGIDVIIGRTLVYLPLMAVLGGMYTAAITLFQRLFIALTGQSSDAALVITVFLVAGAFTPVRRSLEGLVDRWTRPSHGPSEPTGPELQRAATELVSLRRLEARMQGAVPIAGSKRGRGASRMPEVRLPVGGDGTVACPQAGTMPFAGCLGCPYLDAMLTTPPTVVCRPPGSHARPIVH